MSWLHHSQGASCGNPIPKPEKQGKREEIYEDAIPIQDQIENLRAKISLKERYNKALREDLNESNQGASSYLHELSKETKELRQKLMDAVNSERSAVQNALRTHREFQLAMTNKTPGVAIPWLDDKLFDMAKLLNGLLDRLKDKRKRLEESEQMVTVIQKWPRPGTLPWEMEANANFNRLECQIEAQKVKRETAFIIHTKYVDIKFQLLSERGKYTSLLKNMEGGLKILKSELEDLETMLDDAIYFRNETYKNLVLTEKEASENRKRRRIQMAKMKKAVEKILEENQNQRAPTKGMGVKIGGAKSEYGGVRATMDLSEVAEILRTKRQDVEEYQTRARKLVETMRVPDLTHIPLRLKTVTVIGKRLEEELKAKEKLRDLFLKQKAQLQLIMYYYKYTGVTQLDEFEEYREGYLAAIEEAKSRTAVLLKKLDRIGEIQIALRLGMMSIFELLAEGKKKTRHNPHEDIQENIKIITVQLQNLLDQIQNVKSQFGGKGPEKNYAGYVKHPGHQNRVIRVATPHVSEDSDEDEADLMDSKIPSRWEIKSKSARIVNRAHLKRGIR